MWELTIVSASILSAKTIEYVFGRRNGGEKLRSVKISVSQEFPATFEAFVRNNSTSRQRQKLHWLRYYPVICVAHTSRAMARPSVFAGLRQKILLCLPGYASASEDATQSKCVLLPCVEAITRLDATARNATYFKLWGKLLAKVARQGKVAPLITKGGLKSDGHNLSIGLKSGPVGAAVQISK